MLKEKTGNFLTKHGQYILFLLTFVVAVAATVDAIYDFFPLPVSIALYVIAAVGFVMTCTLWVKAISIFIASMVLRLAKNNRVVNILITNSCLRTVMTALPGMGITLIYAAFTGVIGITARSAWHGSLSAYYILLCVIRFLPVFYAKQVYTGKERGVGLEQRECKVYLNCGRILSVSSIALGGAVVMLVTGYGGKSYSGLMIYAAAVYTFCKLTISVINMAKVRKEQSFLLKTLRNISYADALVSLLFLQTALFTAFGSDAGQIVPIMNALTGAVVCMMILGLGIYMVHDAKKSWKIPEEEIILR